METSIFFTSDKVHIRPELAFGIEKAEQSRKVSFHRHDYIELCFVAGGCAIHQLKNRSGIIRRGSLVPGDVFSVQIGEAHAFDLSEHLVFYNLYIQPRFLEQYPELHSLPAWDILFGERTPENDAIIHLSRQEWDMAVPLLDRILYECRVLLPGYQLLLPALVVQLLVESFRFTNWKHRMEVSEIAMLRTIRMIEEKPEASFSLEKLAGAAAKSVSSYTRKFREMTGLSPIEYIQKRRLQQVCHYLIRSDKNIDEIAQLCGFNSANYLIKLFRREFELTPRRYRDEWRKPLKAASSDTHLSHPGNFHSHAEKLCKLK